MKPAPKILLAAALLLVALGVGLAVLQPGGLGGDDEGTQTAQPAVTETETETASDTETETEPAISVDGEANDGTDGTAPTASAPPTSTTAPVSTTSTTPPPSAVGGSGLAGEGGIGTADTEDGLANTGGTSAIGAGLVLGAAGLVLRRRTA